MGILGVRFGEGGGEMGRLVRGVGVIVLEREEGIDG